MLEEFNLSFQEYARDLSFLEPLWEHLPLVEQELKSRIAFPSSILENSNQESDNLIIPSFHIALYPNLKKKKEEVTLLSSYT